MKNNAIRQNLVTKEWVIFAPARRKRPEDFRRDDGNKEEIPGYDSSCPFCPGNEDKLTEILLEVPSGNGDSWQTRVLPNKFPAVTLDGDVRRYHKGKYLAMNAYDRHEEIIESPKHNDQMALMSLEQVTTVIRTYQRRYHDLMSEHSNLMTFIIFRNHGRAAGTSLIHPHSQIIVTSVVPQHIRKREEEAQRYFDTWARCVYCDMLQFEKEEQRRVIDENRDFLAFVPFAAQAPFEIWVMPKNHAAAFGAISQNEIESLAHALQNILLRLFQKLNNPDYNYVINTAPRFKADEPHLHWYLQILPRLTTRAGFEIGSGININPSLPEADADWHSLNRDVKPHQKPIRDR